MSALICGSIAYDTIMVFQDQFKNHILPEKVHRLNVSFLVPEMRQEFGGCAVNIAFNMKLLGADALPMGTVGKDFARYSKWMDDHGIVRLCRWPHRLPVGRRRRLRHTDRFAVGHVLSERRRADAGDRSSHTRV